MEYVKSVFVAPAQRSKPETSRIVSPLKVTMTVVTYSGQLSDVNVMDCACTDAKRAMANAPSVPRRMEVLRFMIKVFSNCRSNIAETIPNQEENGVRFP